VHVGRDLDTRSRSDGFAIHCSTSGFEVDVTLFP